MATTHLLGADMAWHNKPIKLCVCPSTSTQAREYMAVMASTPLAPKPQAQVGRCCPGLPLVTPTLKGTPPQFHMAPRDLNDAQLRQVMEDIWQKAARREGAAPPRGSPIGQWWASAGGVDPDFEDEEVTLQGGPGKLPQQPAGPLKQMMMLVTPSAYLQPD